MEALAGGKIILGVAIVEARQLRPPDAGVGGSARHGKEIPGLIHADALANLKLPDEAA